MVKILKKIVVCALIFATFSVVKAQQIPLYSQYMLNGFLINPAMAGSKDFTPIALTVRQQWVGIDQAPQTYALSGHSAPFLNKKMGVGAYIFSDKFGPIQQTGIQASYAYHLDLNNDGLKLSLGLSISAFQYSMDQTELTTIEPDNSINGAVESTFVPDGNFGAYLYKDGEYFVGASAFQLIQWNVQLGDNPSNANQMVRHYFVTGGYRFDLDNIVSKLKIEPSVLIKATESSPMQADLNVKFLYDDKYWLGTSYRSSKDFITMIGVKVDKYYVAYAFGYTFSSIGNYATGGSHEIMIGFNLGEGADSGSSLL